VLVVACDTPVDDRDEADVPFVRARLEALRPHLRPGTVVLVTSQVPVGFTRTLARDWAGLGLHVAYSPENLRLGKAIACFTAPERIVLGTDSEVARTVLAELLSPFCTRLEWMSLESAEMTKHAINAFLGLSVTFANELARICEVVGADAREVERGLKSEGRIGEKAYLSPGSAFAGGTLARDLRFLQSFGALHRLATPLVDGVLASNDLHKAWLRDKVALLTAGIARPVVAVLGLTYKPGTDTLRRSAAVEFCRWMHGQGIAVQAHDPAVQELPADLVGVLRLHASATAALAAADVAVVATEWPDYRRLTASDFSAAMRQVRVIDPNWFLAAGLGAAPGVLYLATGRPATLPVGARPPTVAAP
jgi:UDPglucose 6-dehydrogenase